MGLWALRGMPSDYDAWAAAGATGWSGNDVVRCSGVWRMTRTAISRTVRPDLIRSAASYGKSGRGLFLRLKAEASRRGHRFIDDINERPGEGFFAMPLSQDTQGCASSARCYLAAEVRWRPNLSILTETTVTGLRFDGRRACGVTVMRDGEKRDIAAREVIVCNLRAAEFGRR